MVLETFAWICKLETKSKKFFIKRKVTGGRSHIGVNKDVSHIGVNKDVGHIGVNKDVTMRYLDGKALRELENWCR